jgi:nicotinamide phosphoribosyltransferase
MTYGIGSGYYNHIDRNLLGFSMKTAFSNKKPRMKFSASGKTSLPGQVRLAYDEKGRMKVYPYNLSKQNDDESTTTTTTPNLYETVYFFDPLVSGNMPVIKHPHYEETWNRAQTVLHEIDKYTQEKIVVSDEILKIMKVIKQNYMPMTTRVNI